jgi:hypothetical protein
MIERKIRLVKNMFVSRVGKGNLGQLNEGWGRGHGSSFSVVEGG